MPFAVGDRVHVQDLGTGDVREVRNGGRYVVTIKGRTMVVSESQMAAPSAPARGRRSADHSRSSDPTPADGEPLAPAPRPPVLDLHGHTVEPALDALAAFLSEALLAGAAEAHVIHGRSGGKLRAAVHARLKELPSIRGFHVDPRNAGVTIVRL